METFVVRVYRKGRNYDYLMYVSLLLGPPPGLGVVRGIEEDAENYFKVRMRILITILLKSKTINFAYVVIVIIYESKNW